MNRVLQELGLRAGFIAITPKSEVGTVFHEDRVFVRASDITLVSSERQGTPLARTLVGSGGGSVGQVYWHVAEPLDEVLAAICVASQISGKQEKQA